MGLACLFGHDWDLCKGKCKRCGKRRAEQHNWNGCQCSKCEKTRHQWNHCTCIVCGEIRGLNIWGHYCNLQLIPEKCIKKCSVCGYERQSHNWQPVRCGLKKCSRCGLEQEDTSSPNEHDFLSYTGYYVQRYNACVCKKCGAPNTKTPVYSLKHEFEKSSKACKVVCKHCRYETESVHNWTRENGICQDCGKVCTHHWKFVSDEFSSLTYCEICGMNKNNAKKQKK